MEYDNNSEGSSRSLDWEILDLYGNRQADLYSDLGRIISPNKTSESFLCPNKDTVAAGFGPYVSGGACVSSPGDHLRLGSRLSGESLSPKKCNKTTTSHRAMICNYEGSNNSSKRSRASYQNMQSPCCQVEGCNLDLKPAKDYHRRHRICEAHSKSPKVVVGGLVRRFCQQCSRFHNLSEFDDKKRSCRKRLMDHNARRRRLPPLESLHHYFIPSSASLPSPLYDHQRTNDITLNGLSSSLSPRSINTRAPDYQRATGVSSARSRLSPSSSNWYPNNNNEEGTSYYATATHMQENGSSSSFLFQQPKGFF